MSNYVLCSNSFCEISDNELMHYGVRGMKWGVRRDPTKAYERASKKMAKLNNKVEKTTEKFYKNAHVHFTDFGVAAERKARRKMDRATSKAMQWKKAMDKEFSNTKLTSLEKKYTSKGEAYLKKMGLASDENKRNSYSDKASKYNAKASEVRKLRENLHGNPLKGNVSYDAAKAYYERNRS